MAFPAEGLLERGAGEQLFFVCSNRVDRLRFAPHLFLTRAPIGLERSDSPIVHNVLREG